MTTPLSSLITIKKRLLKMNLRNCLVDNHDWKVSRAVTTGIPLSESDIVYRNNIVAEYNQRVAALESATTVEDVNKVSLAFG